MNNKPLLTIAIPTYNRCEYLKRLLISIISQVEASSDEIEVIVCDNASTDNTENTARSLLKNMKSGHYYRNENNIGMDGNFLRCRQLANGAFFWMIGDDDFVLPGGISSVTNILKQHPSLNLIYVNSSVEDPIPQKNLHVDFLNSSEDFISRIGVMFTFISGVISRNNKESSIKCNDIAQKINGFFLMHLSWQFLELKNGDSFAIINDKIVKATPDNSGGYKLFTVFSKNLTKILDIFYERESLISKEIRKSSMLFLINFIGNPGKQKKHIRESPLVVCNDFFSDIISYNIIFKYFYMFPFMARLACKIKKTIKRLV